MVQKITTQYNLLIWFNIMDFYTCELPKPCWTRS